MAFKDNCENIGFTAILKLLVEISTVLVVMHKIALKKSRIIMSRKPRCFQRHIPDCCDQVAFAEAAAIALPSLRAFVFDNLG